MTDDATPQDDELTTAEKIADELLGPDDDTPTRVQHATIQAEAATGGAGGAEPA